MYSLAAHKRERRFTNNDPDCRCALCDIGSKYNGLKLNALYNKKATMSSFGKIGRPQCLLVNGISTVDFETTCTHTASVDKYPWAVVDMAHVYSFTNVLLVRRSILNNTHDPDIKRMWSLEISVDGDFCMIFPSGEDREEFFRNSVGYTVSCNKTVTGRYLRVERKTYYGAHLQYLILCELEISVCKPTYFGVSSCGSCPATCKYICNNIYGCDTLAPWNVAMKKTASQSSTEFGSADNAIDGATSRDTAKCTATNPSVDGSGYRWWQVNMGSSYKVFKVHVHNRLDSLGNLLEHFDVFVENEGMLTNSRPTKKCAGHRDSNLGNGVEIVLVCDPSKMNEGQFVILVAPKPYTLQFCEVRVMGHNVIVFEAGASCLGRNEIKRCHLDHSCENNICKINLGGDCTGSKSVHCIAGSVCAGGTCKLDIDVSCTGSESLCRFGAECDPAQAKCKWKLRQTCTTDTCVSGTHCDGLSRCKRGVGKECDDTLDCSAGSECDSVQGVRTCICLGAATGLCDAQTGFAGGKCASGNCLAPNLICTENVCNCESGYTVFAKNFTCKVGVNGNCNTASDCNTGMECVSNLCKLVPGQLCKKEGGQCMPNVCDLDDICRLEVGGNCSHDLQLCKSGAMCEAGVCKLMVGVMCAVARGTECGEGTICTKSKYVKDTTKRCRLRPGQPCFGTNSTLCEEDALCDNDVCKLRLGSDCAGANTVHCQSETTCDSKCKYDLKHECNSTSQCTSTAVCDTLTHKCHTKKGESCLSSGSQCQSGATCVPRSGGDGMVCQCTVQSNINSASAECEPVTNAVGGSCTNQSCSDPNAICNTGICECINGTTLETSNYTCGYGPGKDCRNHTDACNSGTVCDRIGLCLLMVGHSCQGEDRGRCRTGLVCDNDICKLFLNMDCGDNPALCNTGTVCGVNKKCKVSQGSNCGEDSVCVGGANCLNNNCTCISGITQANGSICEPVTGKVHGKCSDGTSCEDQNAVCNTTTGLCICKQGFAPEPDTLACGVAKGESCVDNPSSCITGTTCDPTTQTCRLKLGQICDTNMDCETTAICDIFGECKIDFNGTCITTDSNCRSGTFCDPLKKCRYGEDSECNNTEQCAAGAVCGNNQCACSRELSKSNGATCAPHSGRIGSDCGEVTVCDASLGGKCGANQKCECPADTPVLHDFRCQGFGDKQDDVGNANTSVKKDLALIIGGVVGAVALLACVGLIFGILGRRKNRRKKQSVWSERDANMAALKAMSTLIDADLQKKTEMPQPSVDNKNIGEAMDTAPPEPAMDTAPQEPAMDTAPQEPADPDNPMEMTSSDSVHDAGPDPGGGSVTPPPESACTLL